MLMRRRTIFIIGAITIVVLLGLVGAYMVFITKNSNVADSSPTSNSTSGISAQVAVKINSGDIEGARVVAEDALKANDTVNNRRQLVTVELAGNGYQKAIDVYQPIIDGTSTSEPAKELTYEDYGNIALAYEKIGNKSKAAEYYRKSADNWPTDDPQYDAERGYLYNQADVLEGKKTNA